LHTHYAAFYAIRITGHENYLFQLIEAKITQRLKEIFIENSKQIFLMTETSNKFFKINGNRTVDTFAPGVDIAIFQPVSKRQNKKFRALYIGRWSKDKGTELFSNLFYNIPSIDWTIVGMEGQEEIKFPSNVRRLGILDPKSLAKEMG